MHEITARISRVPEENVNIVGISHFEKEAGKRYIKIGRQGLITGPIKVSEGTQSIV